MRSQGVWDGTVEGSSAWVRCFGGRDTLGWLSCRKTALILLRIHSLLWSFSSNFWSTGSSLDLRDYRFVRERKLECGTSRWQSHTLSYEYVDNLFATLKSILIFLQPCCNESVFSLHTLT